MHVLHVVGARPNFMKAAPVLAALERHGGVHRIPVRQTLVHTGQHYDREMSEVFFRDLGMPAPDHDLGVGAGSHARQTAAVLERLEPVVVEPRPDWVLVYGDVNSTLAAALVAAKLRVRVAHVEAGLRSFDRDMPEELNRIVTDQLADLLFTPSADGDENLAREGVPPDRVRRVGNVMIDTLVRLLPRAEKSNVAGRVGVAGGDFGLVTLHRPANVDEPQRLVKIVDALAAVARELPLVFPVHPRTRERLRGAGVAEPPPGLRLVGPLGYLDFLALERRARLVVTDSGGVQEETTFLGIPCLTLRRSTERPITVTVGTNLVLGEAPGDLDRLVVECARIRAGEGKKGKIPPLWDGRAAERIAAALVEAPA